MEQGLEYFGVLTGLLYLGLEIVQHRAMLLRLSISLFFSSLNSMPT